MGRSARGRDGAARKTHAPPPKPKAADLVEHRARFSPALTARTVQTLMRGSRSRNWMESGPIDHKGRNRGGTLRPGVVVGGKFVLIRQIGQGAVGAIFEAEDTWIGRRVALKVLHPHVARHPDVMWRFRREPRAAASIEHPNIVSVLEVGQRRDGSYYIVQELLEGTSLRRHLEERGQLAVDEALEILVPIMGALVAAHRKDVIHRDIKPENILLARSAS